MLHSQEMSILELEGVQHLGTRTRLSLHMDLWVPMDLGSPIESLESSLILTHSDNSQAGTGFGSTP